MERTDLATICRWAGGRLSRDASAVIVEQLCTDSRTLQTGDLFLALSGERFDGHAFVPEAARLGAAGAVVSQRVADLPAGFPVIEVDDTLLALHGIATNYRRNLPLQVVGVTGSSGKTSTKDLTAAVLGTHFQVLKTAGNFNNHIGVPLTLLRARGSDQIAIVEMGMSNPGEIAPLASMAAPDVAIITNIGTAHIESMGSREAIALEKGSLAEGLPPSGTLIMSASDDFVASIRGRTRADVLLCGFDAGDVRAKSVEHTATGMRFQLCAERGCVEVELPAHGLHMVQNALLAVAAGQVFGLSLEECALGLRQLQLSGGRLQLKNLGGIHVLDDTYNANPDSMIAALRTLATMPAEGRRIAVLGRMAELGAESASGHQRVGVAAAALPLDCLITVGEDAAQIAGEAASSIEVVAAEHSLEDAVKTLRDIVQPGDLVLVKGSRSARMERIVEALAAS